MFAFCAFFGVSRVVDAAGLRLLAPGLRGYSTFAVNAALMASQWHTQRVNLFLAPIHQYRT